MDAWMNLPFERGLTAAAGLASVASTDFENIVGREYKVEDIDPASTTVTGLKARSGRHVTLLAVRNVSGFALLPKRTVKFKAGSYGREVDGYVTATAEKRAGVVDEFLPAAGVANNDVFFIVVEGPTLVLTDLAGGANNLLPADTVLVALTAASSGATTAGRVAPQDLTGATAVLGNQVENRIGRALSAATTANTNADLYTEVFRWS
jgi:hypothetical protein